MYVGVLNVQLCKPPDIFADPCRGDSVFPDLETFTNTIPTLVFFPDGHHTVQDYLILVKSVLTAMA
jgi:hypothetical protein